MRFSGSNLFVNADVTGVLQAEVLDVNGRPIEGFTLDKSARVIGNGTRMPLNWRGVSLAQLAGAPVRFRFTLERARLFAFWVSRSVRGESSGYVAAGGPGYLGETDG